MKAAHLFSWFILSAIVTATATGATIRPDQPNPVVFPAEDAKFVRVLIHKSSASAPCIDELEVYGPTGDRNLALATGGAKATASSCIAGFPIHRIEHLNDGLYGNSHSWISAGVTAEWAQIELPAAVKVAKIVFSRDREGQYSDRIPISLEVQLSLDGKKWSRAAVLRSAADIESEALAVALDQGDPVQYAFLGERLMCRKIDDSHPTARVLGQMREMLDRFAAKGLDVAAERNTLAELSGRHEALVAAQEADDEAEQALFFEARMAKRGLFFREPDLAALERILFVKRQPFLPSHNYSVIFDSQGAGGGAVCVLETPWREGRLLPEEASVERLFECEQGIARDVVADFAAETIYFGYRPTKADYFHLQS
ncbi:MAG: hypothetical protein HQ581_10500, partial [Planctomycetes bacterium]|nr:hypothetical protein [Planctomycetota bacterium]